MRLSALTVVILILGSLVSGCKSIPEIKRENQAERILERTITEVQEVPVIVTKYVPLPSELTRPCKITHGQNRSIKEYVRVAIKNTGYLEQCMSQIESIRSLQPKSEE